MLGLGLTTVMLVLVNPSEVVCVVLMASTTPPVSRVRAPRLRTAYRWVCASCWVIVCVPVITPMPMSSLRYSIPASSWISAASLTVSRPPPTNVPIMWEQHLVGLEDASDCPTRVLPATAGGRFCPPPTITW